MKIVYKKFTKFKASGIKEMKYVSNCASADKITIWVLQHSGTHCGFFLNTTFVSFWVFKMNNILWEWESLSFFQVTIQCLVKWILSFLFLEIKLKYSCFWKKCFPPSQTRNYLNVLSQNILQQILEWSKHSTHPLWGPLLCFRQLTWLCEV